MGRILRRLGGPRRRIKKSGQSFSGLDFQDCSGLFGKPFDRFAADVRVLAMADSASRRWSAAFVYRTSSARLAWPVMAPISSAVQPASARRRAAPFSIRAQSNVEAL